MKSKSASRAAPLTRRRNPEYNEADLARARAGDKNLRDTDLRGADLSGMDLSGVNFVNASLTGASLVGAKLVKADLTSANLDGANFSGADLTGANLYGVFANRTSFLDANLRKAVLGTGDFVEANFSRSNLQDADLRSAHLAHTNLTGATLVEARLEFADLDGALLRKTSFLRAWMEGINMNAKTQVEETDFSGADLTRAYLREVEFHRTNFTGAGMEQTKLREAVFERCDLSYATLSEASAASVMFLNTKAKGAIFSYAVMDESVWNSVDLTDAHLVGTDVSSSTFRGVNLEDAHADHAYFRWTKFDNTLLTRTHLSHANLSFAKGLAGTDLSRKSMNNVNLSDVDLSGVDFHRSDLSGAILQNTNLSNADLSTTNLSGADLENANLEGADLENATILNTNLVGTLLEDLLQTTKEARSYGRQTGPVLKMGKPDAPSRAAEFKKRYPAEFERLKADTQGRDFSEPLRTQVRKTYETPFVWLVSEGAYAGQAQRLCPSANLVYKFNVDLRDPSFTERQREFLKKLAETSRRSDHPHERGRLFTVGWVRICENASRKTWLVEEVQSDVGVVREKLKDGSAPPGLEEYADVIADLRPYIDRFYEDALGVVLIEAEKKDYAVEMLTYESKKSMGSPRSVYTDLPRAMGMQRKKGSDVLPLTYVSKDAVETWYYKPNPRKGAASSRRSTRSARKRR